MPQMLLPSHSQGFQTTPCGLYDPLTQTGVCVCLSDLLGVGTVYIEPQYPFLPRCLHLHCVPFSATTLHALDTKDLTAVAKVLLPSTHMPFLTWAEPCEFQRIIP